MMAINDLIIIIIIIVCRYSLRVISNKNVTMLSGINSWTQGEVTKLFTKIAENGYKILYLSARSIR